MMNNYFYLPYLKSIGCDLQERLATYDITQWYDTDAIDLYQNDKLKSLFKYILQYVPYFGIKRTNINSLTELPIISKESLRTNPFLFTSTQSFHNTVKKSSGGSTGISTPVVKTQYARSHYLAGMWRGYKWAGINVGDKRAQFTVDPGTLKSKLSDIINNRSRFSAKSFNDDILYEYCLRYIKYDPDFIYGYGSMISEFAQYAINHDIKLVTSKLKSVITTSEVLSKKDRYLIEDALQTYVYDEYGCGEIGTIAHECDHGSMHINYENVFLEIVDDNYQPVPIGQIGHILVTELNNLVMPLVRYDLGDIGALSSERCQCGRMSPILLNIAGRSRDFLLRSDGTKIFSGASFANDLVKDLPIIRYQLVQNTVTDFIFKAVVSDSFKYTITNQVTEKLKSDFGDNIVVKFEFPNNIPKSVSGKNEVVIGIR